MTRKPINKDIEADVLLESRRRCCICYGLNRDLNIKSGQIAHLDKDNTNNSHNNLVFLCFDHHDQYDSKTSQSKNFTIKEVKRYRQELSENFLTIQKSGFTSTSEYKTSSIDFKKEEIRKVLIEILSESGTITALMPISYKTRLSKTTIEDHLIELAQEKIIRIDRAKGSLNRTFSLAESNENLIIDAFIKTLGDSVTEEQRYVRKNHYEIDAIIYTSDMIYIVEVNNAKYLNPERVSSIISRLNRCRKEMNISDSAKNVLLIGMNDSTERLNDSLKEIESQGVTVKYIEINK